MRSGGMPDSIATPPTNLLGHTYTLILPYFPVARASTASAPARILAGREPLMHLCRDVIDSSRCAVVAWVPVTIKHVSRTSNLVIVKGHHHRHLCLCQLVNYRHRQLVIDNMHMS